MESTPSSGPEAPAPLTRRTNPALAVREWSRSRRVRTFGLGALCGALGLSLVIVITSIFAASDGVPPLSPDEPAPVSEVRTTPRPTPTSTPTPTPPPSVETVDDPVDAPADDLAAPPSTTDPAPAPVEPEPAPAPSEEAPASPGQSGSAPGHTRPPKQP